MSLPTLRLGGLVMALTEPRGEREQDAGAGSRRERVALSRPEPKERPGTDHGSGCTFGSVSRADMSAAVTTRPTGMRRCTRTPHSSTPRSTLRGNGAGSVRHSSGARSTTQGSGASGSSRSARSSKPSYTITLNTPTSPSPTRRGGRRLAPETARGAAGTFVEKEALARQRRCLRVTVGMSRGMRADRCVVEERG